MATESGHGGRTRNRESNKIWTIWMKIGCLYCANLDRYDLLPAEDIDIQKWVTMSGNSGGGEMKRMHAPKHPVGDFRGIECQRHSA